MTRLAVRIAVVATIALAVALLSVPREAEAAKPPAAGTFTMSLSSTSVDFGALDPEVPVAVPAALDVTVNGFKLWGTMQLTYEATAFANADPTAGTPTMPVSVMSYAVSGDATVPQTQMAPAGTISTVDVVDITKNNWDYAYTFDFSLDVPFDYEAGDYAAGIMYTAVVW